MSQSVQANITKYHILVGLKREHLILTEMETKSAGAKTYLPLSVIRFQTASCCYVQTCSLCVLADENERIVFLPVLIFYFLGGRGFIGLHFSALPTILLI